MWRDIRIKVECREHTDEEGAWAFLLYQGFESILDKGGELVDGECPADMDMGEYLMLVQFTETGISCDVVGVGSHATIDVDGVAVEDLVGAYAETVGHLGDKCAVAIDESELTCFETTKETIKFGDAGCDDKLWPPGMCGFLKRMRNGV